jgi:hypothetical protein
MRRWLLLLALGGTAEAHVAPSADTNNRYLALTPMADRVRLAYTILIGEAPGQAARKVLDTDHDGRVSDTESQAWAKDLAEKVRASLEVTFDGKVMPVTWAQVEVGMDDRSVDAGAFSLDLIAWFCVPDRGARRTFALADHYALTPAGETEVRIADQPGISVSVATVGANEMAGHVARFEQTADPLDGGMKLVYDVGDARPLADGMCPAPPSGDDDQPVWPYVLVSGIAGTLATFFAARKRFGR